MLEKIRQLTIVTKALSSLVKLVIMIIVVILLLWQLAERENKAVDNNLGMGTAFNVVDALNDVPVDVNVSRDVEKFEVYKMPEFLLSLPGNDLFSDDAVQKIASLLGFTDKAQIINIGSQLGYREGPLSIMFDRQLGQMNFSTAFNFSGVTLAPVKPTNEKAKDAVLDFLAKSRITTAYFDLENMSYEDMYVDNLGTLTPARLIEGTLVKVVIPYQVSGVRVLLPSETYAVVDGFGKIRLMTMIVPSITQTNRVITLMSWGDAKSIAERGGAAVIRYGSIQTGEFSINSSYPAYYLNQRTFYSLDKPRRLQPIYVFEGGNGMVAVSAERR